MSCFEAEYSTPTWASTLILFCVLHRKKMLTDANAGLRPRNDVWYLCCTCNLLLYAFIFIWPDYTDVEPFCLQRKAAITNEWGIFCMFYSMSTSDQPALIEQNKLNLRGSGFSQPVRLNFFELNQIWQSACSCCLCRSGESWNHLWWS